MCRRSLSLPGKFGLPFPSFFEFPPFHSLVVSQVFQHLHYFSKTLVIISVVIADIMIGLPLIDPELSSNKLTIVFFSLISFSFL